MDGTPALGVARRGREPPHRRPRGHPTGLPAAAVRVFGLLADLPRADRRGAARRRDHGAGTARVRVCVVRIDGANRLADEKVSVSVRLETESASEGHV